MHFDETQLCMHHLHFPTCAYICCGTEIYEVGASVRTTKGSAARVASSLLFLLSPLGSSLLLFLSVREGG
jgi:hypothetical protein